MWDKIKQKASICVCLRRENYPANSELHLYLPTPLSMQQKIKEERNHLLFINIGRLMEFIVLNTLLLLCLVCLLVAPFAHLADWKRTWIKVCCYLPNERGTAYFILFLPYCSVFPPARFFSLLFAQVEAETSPFQPVDRRLTRHG